MLAIAFFGLVAYRSLPVSDLPNVDFPTLSVFAGLPGASPETMAAAVATPLEKQFSTIEGLDSMTTSSPATRLSRSVQPERDPTPRRTCSRQSRARPLVPAGNA
jgi:HAE1 family hydrophobic/amphiphilic exporter-1